jgi:hypothetical protein
LKISALERTEIVKPFVRVIGIDFFNLFRDTLHSYATLRNQALVSRASHDPNPANLAAVRDHSDRITAWTKRTQPGDLNIRIETFNLVNELNRIIPRPDEWLSGKEIEVADRLKGEIIKLNEACEKKGGYTEDAATFYDRYHENTELKAQELFGHILADIK